MTWILRLIPAADREAIAGDLLEEAAFRGLSGTRLRLWLLGECGTIAAGLSAERVRAWVVLPPLREVVSGLAIDGRGLLRDGPVAAVSRALLFCGAVATIAVGVEILVSALLRAF
jgi:hypothetical protein